MKVETRGRGTELEVPCEGGTWGFSTLLLKIRGLFSFTGTGNGRA